MRYGEVCSAGEVQCSAHTLHNWHRGPADRHASNVKCPHRTTSHPLLRRRYVRWVDTARPRRLNYRLPLRGSQLLDDDLGAVPPVRTVAYRKRKEDAVAAGQQLRTMCNSLGLTLTTVSAALPSSGSWQGAPSGPWPTKKAATFPRDTEWALHSRKAHRCIATRNCDFPQRLIARHPEGKKAPIRREHRAHGTRKPRSASQWLAFTCREGTHIDLLVGDVHHLLPVARERDELATGVREVLTVLKGNLEPHDLACRGFG